MRDESSKKSKFSWSKTFVKKWFSFKSKTQDFQAVDDVFVGGGGKGEWRTSFSQEEACTVKKNSRTECSCRTNLDRVWRGRFNVGSVEANDVQDYKIFVSTWNVAGKSPPTSLNLEELLHASPPADIYVLGFQEIVPLNAGNVLGAEDNGPAKKWLALIRKTLDTLPGTYDCGSYSTAFPILNPLVELDADFEGSSIRQKNSSFFHRRSLRVDGDIMAMLPRLDRRFSVCDRVSIGSRSSDFDPNYGCEYSSDDEKAEGESPSTGFSSPMSYACGAQSYMEERDRSSFHSSSRYTLVASKQMVGIFLTIWVRNEIRSDVQNLKVSCVGRGLMGYLGNKGSISISMSLHRTSFCFICSHLTSGEKEGDELKRNSDVMEILRKTRFPRVHTVSYEKSPETILEHDRVIWLGDLNYRIALTYQTTKSLLGMRNWRALLEKDQLQIEQRYGRVFRGWKEGRICFPPTYKYANNSDRYTGYDIHRKEKRRTPAWCDRILWYGRGLVQLVYLHGESRFSDHRPVYSIFSAEVETVNHSRTNKNLGCSSSQVEVEELLPSYSHGYRELNFYNFG